MDNVSLVEHSRIVGEMLAIRDCITNFTGFMLVGSGGLVAHLVTKLNWEHVAVASSIAALIISLVFLILIYKFNSHNRMSGYLKVLEHEVLTNIPPNVDDLTSWEICVGRLFHYSEKGRGNSADVRASLKRLCEKIEPKDRPDIDLERLSELVTGLTSESYGVKQYFKSRWEGVRILVSALVGRVHTQSWPYPAYIAVIFFCTVVGFMIASLVAMTVHEPIDSRIAVLFLAISLILLWLWWGYCAKLYQLMRGTASVDSFFWRFFLIRVSFLNQRDIRVNYPHAGSWFERTCEKNEV